jgi:uncharacterized membrane protein YgcG
MGSTPTRSGIRRAGRTLFGDRAGFALFLGCLCFVLLYWRAGIFITDNITLREGLRALAEGHLWIEPATGNYLQTPGTSVENGYVYGRNYGQLFLSLPVLWGLQAVDLVADLHVALVALWHLLALGLVVQVGRLVSRRRIVTYAGSALVAASFVLNVGLATQFASVSRPLLALQLTTAVASGFVAVAIYRVIALHRTRRLALLAGAAVVVALPVGFWATIPKRHVFATLVCAEVLYLFTRSRESPGMALPGLGTVPVYRAGAYASAALLTWDHAAAGLFVFLALVAVDVPTAPSNDPRDLAFVGAVFGIALLPMFLTNYLVAGDPFRPPRTLYGSGVEGPAAPGSGGGAGGSAGGGSAGGGRDGSLWRWGPIGLLVDVVRGAITAVGLDWVFYQMGWLIAQTTFLVEQGLSGLTRGDEVVRTFLRSNVEGIAEDARFLGVNLSVLESAPLLGAMALAAVHAVSERVRSLSARVAPTDALALLLIVAFVLLYNDRLPLNTTITVRYLLPIYPLGVYLLARSVPVGGIVADHGRSALWAYAGGVLVGGQLLLAYLFLGDFAVAEAARVHATLGFGLGLVVAGIAVGTVVDDRFRQPTAVALGLAAAAGTVFLLLSGLHYFSFVGEYVLPVAGALSDVLAAAA